MENVKNAEVLEEVVENVTEDAGQKVSDICTSDECVNAIADGVENLSDICNPDVDLNVKQNFSPVLGTIGIFVGAAAIGLGIYFIRKEIKRIKEQRKAEEENEEED